MAQKYTQPEIETFCISQQSVVLTSAATQSRVDAYKNNWKNDMRGKGLYYPSLDKIYLFKPGVFFDSFYFDGYRMHINGKTFGKEDLINRHPDFHFDSNDPLSFMNELSAHVKWQVESNSSRGNHDGLLEEGRILKILYKGATQWNDNLDYIYSMLVSNKIIFRARPNLDLIIKCYEARSKRDSLYKSLPKGVKDALDLEWLLTETGHVDSSLVNEILDKFTGDITIDDYYEIRRNPQGLLAKEKLDRARLYITVSSRNCSDILKEYRYAVENEKKLRDKLDHDF